MNVFDTTILVPLLQEKAPPVVDRQKKPVDKARERVQHLVHVLSEGNALISIPTPVLAEIMVRAGNAGPQYLKLLGDAAKFKLSTFDLRAAIEASELIRKIKDDQPHQDIGTWAKAKFDIQIVAIAKAEGCGVIDSEDPHIENHAKRLSIEVRRICDLPLPAKQESLFGASHGGE